jgi:hypothetical protein
MQQWKSGQTTVKLENKILRVGGNGVMEDYHCNMPIAGTAPWYGDCFFDDPKFCHLPITDVVIENGVTHIGKFAFCGLKKLKNVTIPASVVSIGEGAFHNCSSLTSITVATDNAYYASVDGVLFNKNKTILIRYPQGKNGAYTIPSSVTTVGAAAFHGSTGLTSVTIPNSVTIIESGLELLPYRDHNSLTSITGDVKLGWMSGTFGNCTSLASITIPSSVTFIGNWAFSGCTGLTSLMIENGVESIGKYAFFDCTSLTSITIPNSVTSIGDRAFSGCTGLTSLTVAEDNTNYSSVDGVLFNKTKDTLIHYPGGRLGAYTIPDSVTSIGNWAFQGCTGLTSVTFPSSVMSIGKKAFFDCTTLTSVTFEGGVLAFNLYFLHVFLHCINLTSVTIPSNVTNIRILTFGNRLTSIISLNPMPPIILHEPFVHLPSNACLYVPEGSIDVYRAADGWNHFNCIKDLESAPKGE